jgi:hypothetical protein
MSQVHEIRIRADGSIEESFVPAPAGYVPLSPETEWERVRAQRDRVFAQTVDRLNPLRWAEMSPEQQAAWSAYRQQLKDITLQSDPFAIVWPTPPA